MNELLACSKCGNQTKADLLGYQCGHIQAGEACEGVFQRINETTQPQAVDVSGEKELAVKASGSEGEGSGSVGQGDGESVRLWTPGPWECDPEEDYIHYQGAMIARVYGEDDFPCYDPDEHEDQRYEFPANKVLIAAAPELYDALEEIMKVVYHQAGNDLTAFERERVEKAKAALAKATNLAASPAQAPGTQQAEPSEGPQATTSQESPVLSTVPPQVGEVKG